MLTMWVCTLLFVGVSHVLVVIHNKQQPTTTHTPTDVYNFVFPNICTFKHLGFQTLVVLAFGFKSLGCFKRLMYMYTYIYKNTYIYMYIHTHIFIWVYVDIYAYLYMGIRTHIYIYMYTYSYTHVTIHTKLYL